MYLVRTAWFVVLATLSSFSFGQRIDWITTPTKTYVVSPAKVVAEGSFLQVKWSDDNKAALVLMNKPFRAESDASAYLESILSSVKQRPVSSHVLAEWDRASNTMKMVWQPEIPGCEISEISWFKNSHRFLFATSTPDLQDQEKENCTVWLGQAMQESVRPRALIDGLAEVPAINFAPGSPRAVIDLDVTNRFAAEGQVTANATPNTLHLVEYSDSGEVLSRHDYTSDPKDGVVVIRWNKQGTRYHLNRYLKRKVVERIALTDSGPRPLTDESEYIAPPPSAPILSVVNHSVRVKYRKSKALVGGTWLSSTGESMHPELLISTGRSQVELASGGDTIFIAQNGVISTRTLIEVPDEALGRLYAQLRSQALNSAKQLALGMLLFANDNDDVLPGGDSAGDDISPYIKNDDLLSDLNYTPPSDLNMNNIESPAETIIGYVDGPGGRAYIYSDGHAKWKNNP